jgi:hypothetical protein
MTKLDLIEAVNNIPSDKKMVFVERLDSGENNNRTMNCSKARIIEILNTYFDDNLHGHVVDERMTTIVSYLLK